MDASLANVLRAHGGLDSWARIKRITAKLSLGGPFWAGRGWPDVYAGQTVTIDPHREHIEFTPFTAPDRTSILDVDPERVVPIGAAGREGHHPACIVHAAGTAVVAGAGQHGFQQVPWFRVTDFSSGRRHQSWARISRAERMPANA